MYLNPAGGSRPTSDELRRRIAARLDELSAGRPSLGPALHLQRTLLNRELDLLDVIVSGGLPGLTLPQGYLVAKLRSGVPALHREPIPLPSKLLELSAREFCDYLAKGGAADLAVAVARAIDAGQLDTAALVSSCFGRDQHRVRFMAAERGLSPDIVWLVAELALAPFAFLLQDHVLARPAETHDQVRNALRSWDVGFCPACGSWPAMEEAVGGAHRLRCSFCAAAWELSSYRCIYCANDDESFITAAPDAEHAGRRLQLCGKCGGYVKVIESDTTAPFPLLAIEDLATMDLDMAAIERKYMRPALPEIKKRHP